ncbi:MAG: glycerophosphodiester phosphodiesterase, partial [Maioricimonas sp. JB049]
PTLMEVLETCRGRIGVNIELKYYGHDVDLERKVVELVEQTGMTDQVVIMSLEARALRRIRTLRPGWTVGLLTAVAAGDLTRADADFLAVSTRLATSAFIRAAHRRGKKVHVWTVNDAHSMSTLISRGVDNIITDEPALARRVLEERARLSPVERALLELTILFGIDSTAPSSGQ